MKNIFSPISFQSKEQIQEYQWQKLKETVEYVEKHSSFYQKLFRTHCLTSKNITSWEDFRKIPFTTKNDLQNFNDDFLCIPRHEIIDYCTTSGTLGTPVTFGLSERDLERLAYNEATSFACAGVQRGDVVQLMTTMDKRFMAGLAYFLGLRKLGASVIRMGANIPELQWDSILRYQPKYIVTVPSFLLKIIEYAENHNIDYSQSSVQSAICIGEPIRNNDFTPNTLSKEIGKKWNIKLFSTYASTEMSTAFTECNAQNGGHLTPELIITEIINQDGQLAKEGEIGELVITTLGVEAMPLLRFKTGDMLQAHHSPCICGRNSLRLGAVIGRKQHMIKYKGTTLYPPAIQEVLTGIPNIQLHQTIVKKNDIGTDEIIVKIATEHTTESFLKEIKDHFRAKLRVSPTIIFEEASTLRKKIFIPTHRKPIVFVDERPTEN